MSQNEKAYKNRFRLFRVVVHSDDHCDTYKFMRSNKVRITEASAQMAFCADMRNLQINKQTNTHMKTYFIPAINYETKINGVTVTLYTGLDGDYHVTREDSEMEHDHEIFNDFEMAKAFFDALVENNIESMLRGMTFNEVKEALEERGFTCVGKVELMYDDWNVNDTLCEIWEKDGKQVEISPLHEYGNGECFIENDTDIQTIFEAYRASHEGRIIRCTNLKSAK